MELEFSNVEGVTEKMVILNGNTVLSPNDTYLGYDGEFSQAIGRRRKKRRSGRVREALGLTPEMRERRQKRRDDVVKSFTKTREMNAETQRRAVQAASRPDQSAQQVAAAISSSTPGTAPEPTGMSKGMKTGLIVGGIVVAAVLGYAIYRYTKKKK